MRPAEPPEIAEARDLSDWLRRCPRAAADLLRRRREVADPIAILRRAAPVGEPRPGASATL